MIMAKIRAAEIRRNQRQYRLLTLCALIFGLAALYSTSAMAAKGIGGGGGGGCAGAGVFAPGPAFAPPLVPPQFNITGFIQEATLDTTGNICQVEDARLAGG